MYSSSQIYKTRTIQSFRETSPTTPVYSFTRSSISHDDVWDITSKLCQVQTQFSNCTCIRKENEVKDEGSLR